MKQILKRWTGIGLIAASVLTMGGMFTLPSDTNVALSASPQQVLMADGGGDRPTQPPCPRRRCLSGDATV